MDLLEKMGTYVRVIEAGSFSTAAKQLKLTSGAVSRQIATLEADLGVPLLMRSTRAMVVTAEGQLYYEQCLRVLREVDDAQAIGRRRGVTGIIRVSAPVSFGIASLMPRLSTLRTKHPDLAIELRLEDRLLGPLLEGLDVLVRAAPTVPISNGIIARPLTSFPFVAIASPSYVRRKGEPATPEELVRHDALGCRVGPGVDEWMLTNGSRDVRIAMTDRITFRCNALQAVREQALAGFGIALLPDWFVEDDIRSGLLRSILPEWKTEPFAVNALYRTSHRATPRIRAFLDHLVDAYAASDRGAKPRHS